MRSDSAEAEADVDTGGKLDKNFRAGDAVLHAAFGEGTVTALEPGGVITVRFSTKVGERKLMAEYAPITRRPA